jgi:hypothetical protein
MEFNIDKFRRKYTVLQGSIVMMWKIHEKISLHHYKLRQQKEVASGFHDPETMEEPCCVPSNKQYTTTKSSSNLKKVSYFLDECSVCE